MSTTPSTVWRYQVLGGHPPSPNRRMDGRRRYRMVKPLTEELAWQCLGNRPRVPLPRAHCHLVFTYARGVRPRDDDNATSSAKELIDTLVACHVIAGDGPGQLNTSVEHRHGARAELVLEVTPGGTQGSGGMPGESGHDEIDAADGSRP
jgi:hypothetical protein